MTAAAGIAKAAIFTLARSAASIDVPNKTPALEDLDRDQPLTVDCSRQYVVANILHDSI